MLHLNGIQHYMHELTLGLALMQQYGRLLRPDDDVASLDKKVANKGAIADENDIPNK